MQSYVNNGIDNINDRDSSSSTKPCSISEEMTIHRNINIFSIKMLNLLCLFSVSWGVIGQLVIKSPAELVEKLAKGRV